jgi:NADPH:quinone reductase-like Zn-dependent oxidoreductase
MKVVELTGPGLEAIRVADRPEEVLQPGQVRLRLKAVSLNHRDLLIAKGRLPLTYPRIPLSDAVGEVIETAGDVTRVKVGDRVCPTYYPDWVSGGIAPEKFARDRGGDDDGVAVEHLVCSEGELVHVAPHLTDEEASALPCAAVTAWSAITRHMNLQPGCSVLIQGTGGVSLFALQFALAAGAETYLISSSSEKLRRAQLLGAHHVLNYQEVPQWGEEVFDRTGGRGIDLIIDVAGPNTLAQAVTAAATGGHISLVGVLSGFDASIPLYPIITKEVHIDGIISGSRDSAEAMMRAISHHQVRPIVESGFEITDLANALRRLDGQSHFGKLVINMDT